MRNFNFISLIQQQNWAGVAVFMAVSVLFVYAVSAILYFTGEIAGSSSGEVRKLYELLVIQNVLGGTVLALITLGFSRWVVRKSWALTSRHIALSGLVLIGNMMASLFVDVVYGHEIYQEIALKDPAMLEPATHWSVYLVGQALVANVMYYMLGKGRELAFKFSHQEFQLIEMERMKTRAELESLQARINPHFLHNSLNSIASLVYEDPQKAEKMTLLLSKLFRYATGHPAEDYFSTVAEELEIVDAYLEVEQVRYGDRLKIEFDVSDPSLDSLKIPKFLLQPLVENAVKHGISRLADNGKIKIRLYEEFGWVYFQVHDNGPPFTEDLGSGYGTRSIQEKLRLLYGDSAGITFRNGPIKQVSLSICKTDLKGRETNL